MKTHTIEVDQEVYSALESRVRGFHDTENSVLRRILLEDNGANGASALITGSPQVPKSSIIAFVTDSKFQALDGGLDRFLAMLSWLHNQHQEKFAGLPSLSFGSRKYFGRSEREILDTAPGTKAKQIPNSEYWVMVTFSNDDKKKLLRRVMRFFGYAGTETERVLREFPDSKKRHGFDFGDML